MKRLLLALALLGLPVAALAQTSAVPTLFSYHGKVTDATGTLIGAGTPVNRAVTFRIWASPTSVSTTAANRLYTEVQTVTIANGEFSVLLGTGAVVGTELKPALDTVFNGAERYLGITVDDPTVSTDPEISPRQQMVSTAFAFRAKVAEGVPAGAITNAMIAAGAIAGDRIATNTITATQIANSTITATQIAAGTITSDKLAPGAGGTSAFSSTVSVTSDRIGNNVLASTNLDYSEHLLLRWATGAAATPSTAGNNDKVLALGYIVPAATPEIPNPAGYGVIQGHHRAVAWSGLKLNPNGGLVEVGPTGLSVGGPTTVFGGIYAGAVATGALDGSQIKDGTISAAKLSFTPGGGTPAANSVTSSTIVDLTIANADIANGAITAAKFATSSFGYAKFPDGVRSDVGLNVNHDGTPGTTSTIKANASDTIFMDMFDGTTSTFKVRKNGSVNVGARSNTNAMFTVGDVAASVTIPLKVQDSLSPYGDTATAYTNSGLSTVITAGTAMTPTAVIRARSGDDALLFLQNSDGKAKFWFNANSTCFRGDGGTNFNTWSDARLKRDIQPLTGALDKLLQLRSVTFEYLHAPGKPETGFVAQEVEKIFPDWVQKGDDGLLSLSIRGFESRTVQALRELRAEKDQQLQQRDATIAALEKNVAAMKSESAETKAQLAALQQAMAALSARASN